MLLKNGSFYYEKRLVIGDLRVTGETIAAFSSQTAGGLMPLANEEVLELGGAAVIPAFLDIHTHGAVGVDVNAASAEDFEKLARFFCASGDGQLSLLDSHRYGSADGARHSGLSRLEEATARGRRFTRHPLRGAVLVPEA